MGFLGGAVVRNPPASAGDKVSTPGWEDGNPLQYSCLRSPMDRGAWWAMGLQRVGHNSAHTHTRYDSKERNGEPSGKRELAGFIIHYR